MPYSKGENPNHPKKGSSIKVDPIKSQKAVERIKDITSVSPRNFCLFIVGINTNLRASDLIRIKVGDVRGVRAMEDIELKEKKTGKTRRINLNKACTEAIKDLLASGDFQDHEPLFQANGHELSTVYINMLVKRWTKKARLRGNYGSHTLRKTWGYHQRVRFKTPIPELMTCFNHSSQKQTLDYLCVQPEEIRKVYRNEI